MSDAELSLTINDDYAALGLTLALAIAKNRAMLDDVNEAADIIAAGVRLAVKHAMKNRGITDDEASQEAAAP